MNTTIVFNADFASVYLAYMTGFVADFTAAFQRVSSAAAVAINSVVSGSIIASATVAFPAPASGAAYSCAASQAFTGSPCARLMSYLATSPGSLFAGLSTFNNLQVTAVNTTGAFGGAVVPAANSATMQISGTCPRPCDESPSRSTRLPRQVVLLASSQGQLS